MTVYGVSAATDDDKQPSVTKQPTADSKNSETNEWTTEINI